MLGRSGEVKILDWGLVRLRASGFGLQEKQEEEEKKEETAQVSERVTITGAALGTPAYMSPEQALGDPTRVGPATDVYALGAILYEILSGGPPYSGALRQVLVALTMGTLPPPSARVPERRIPRELEAIAAVAMARDPAGRYPSASAFAADLDCWLEGRTVSVLPGAAPLRALRSIARHPLASTCGAAALALAAGVLVHAHHASSLSQTRERERIEDEASALLARALADARTASSAGEDARAAREEWRALFDAWRSEKFAEDELLASRPALPSMENGETLERFEERTRKALAAAMSGVAHARSSPEPFSEPGAREARSAALAGRERLLLACEKAERYSRRALESAREAASFAQDTREARAARDGIVLAARLRLECELALAGAVEADEISPGVLAEAGKMAAWGEGAAGAPLASQGAGRPWEEGGGRSPPPDRESPDLVPGRWTAAAAAFGLFERAAREAGWPGDSAAEAAAARLALSGLALVRIAALPEGCRGELRRATGEELWAEPRPGEASAPDDRAGTVLIAVVPAEGFEAPLPAGEYLLVLSRGEGEVRHPFLVERGRAAEIGPAFPDEVPAGTVFVPGGLFLAGGTGYQSLPRHRSRAGSFFIQTTEVSIGEYARFLGVILESGNDTLLEAALPVRRLEDGVGPLLSIHPDGRYEILDEDLTPDHPVSGVSYLAAAAYARWRTETDLARRRWRLPTGPEWELAAGGPAGRAWPWGERFDPSRARSGDLDGVRFTDPVLAHPDGRSIFGCYQLAGNLWEWTATPFSEDSIAVKGGGWAEGSEGLRVSSRLGNGPRAVTASIGFRLVCEP
ncbi:MAG: SUMF1/EgtB/PvdO family nonheme iron enzyme [Planctomycetes bacterium]|nr:SUMF1/EgtB/PvdO family nonheme iron enzyme [Planctomycetota bacterium]